MGKLADQILEIVDKYEIPKEMHDALWDAYELGVTNAILVVKDREIRKSIEEFNKSFQESQ